MNILCISGQILDIDQISATTIESNLVRLTFRNGDQLPLPWRDEFEKQDILRNLATLHPE